MKKRVLLLIISVFFLSSCFDIDLDDPKTLRSFDIKLKDGVTVYQGDNFNKYRDAFIGTFHFTDGTTKTFNPFMEYYSDSYIPYDEGCKDLSFFEGFNTDTLGEKTATYHLPPYNYVYPNSFVYTVEFDFKVLPIDFAFYNGELMSYNGSKTDVVIPPTIYGQNVTKIGYGAFKNKNITSVIIPETVTTISPYAFANNKNLKSINLPSLLTEINNFSFYACGLESLTIPQSVKTIKQNAFQFNKISNIILPESIESIDSEAFSDNKLTTLTLPSSLRTIGERAFEGNQISNIIIPQGVKTIKDKAFLYNTIDTVMIPNSVEEIGLNSFYSFPTYTKIKELTIPSKFKETINNYFYERPENITYID